jgi:hypothetical protein
MISRTYKEEVVMAEKKGTLSRRNFLMTLGAGSAATAAAIVAKSPASPAAPAKDKRSTRGYQASAHVSNYYRTAKV